ncbi:hypothetical protein [Eubacterium pyruvativorans]|uniref:hypothetical protein n=1 Tax=Eubacterium pyruvativorans TaxID=155865 RepID=UPI003F8C956A
MTMVKSSKKALAVLLAVACLITFMPAMASQSFAAKKLTVKPAKKTIYVKKSFTLKANQKVKWSASKSSLKVVKLTSKKAKSVKVTGKKAGKAVVTAKVGKQTKKVTITVKKAKAAVKKTAVTAVALSADNAKDPAKEVLVGTKLRAAVTPENATVTYQWKADGTAITGATGSTFTVTTAEIGKAITVEATGTGNFEKTAVSAATAKVAAVKVTGVAMKKANDEGKYEDTFTGGTANVGDSFQLQAGKLEGVNSLSDAVDIQWYRNSKSVNSSDGETPIAGATTDTYTLTKDDIGYTVTAKVTPKAGVTVAGNTKGANETAYPIATIGSPTGITGTVKAVVKVDGKKVTNAALGATLTAEVTPADAAVTYQWYKDSVKLDGATSATYTAKDKGSYTVKVSVATTEKTYSGTVTPDAVTVGGDVVGAATLKTRGNEDDLLTDAEKSQYTYAGRTLIAEAQKMGGVINDAQCKWYKNGIEIKGATGLTYDVSEKNAAAGDVFYAEVSSGGITVKTNTITVKAVLSSVLTTTPAVAGNDKKLSVTGLPTPANAVLGTAYTATVKADIYDDQGNFVSSTSMDITSVDKDGAATVELGNGIVNQLKNGYKIKARVVVKGAGNYIGSAQSTVVTGTATVSEGVPTSLAW